MLKLRYLRIALLFLSACGFADSTDIDFETIFVTPATDISIAFLGAIFGSITTVLTSGSNAVVAKMFYVFNTGVITFTAMLIFYTMTMSVINTAQDGNAMGQKVSTWIVLRIVTGMAFLVPSYNGYSAIQVLVMWAVTQGVGFADTIWSEAIDTMAEYGGVAVLPMNQGLDLDSDDGTDSTGSSQYYDEKLVAINDSQSYDPTVVKPAGVVSDIFYASICSKALYRKCVEDSGTEHCDIANYGYWKKQEYQESSTEDSATPSKWCFGSNSYCNEGGDSTTGSCAEFESYSGSDVENDGAYYAEALDATILSVAPMAVDYYDGLVSTCEGDDDLCTIEEFVGSDQSNQGCAAGVYNSEYVCTPAQILISGAATYYTTSLPDRLATGSMSDSTTWMDSAKEAGWAMAGAYYRDLVGGGATNQLSLLDVQKFTTKAGDGVDTGERSAAWSKAYDQLVSEQFKNKRDSNNFTAMQWFANSAYYWLETVMSSTYATTDSSSGTVSSSLNDNPMMDAYNTFTALMIDHLYKKNNPFSSLGTGESAYFPYEGYGDFTKYPGYIWNLVSYNLSYLAGLNLYKTGINNLFPEGSYSVPSITSGCDSISACSDDANDYSGCFSQAVSKGCIFDESDAYPFTGILGQASAAAQSYYADPIITLANTGQIFIRTSMKYWGRVIEQNYSDVQSLAGAYMATNAAFAVSFGALAGATSYIPLVDLGGMWSLLSGSAQTITTFFFSLDRIIMDAYLPLGAAIATLFFSLGILMGLYIPFIPFLLFFFGVISWLISVVESMVAAPLIAMGVTHPEGHDLLGKAEQSIMLLLGVFLRPAAMIIGLIIAITLNYIMLGFLNYGYIYTLNKLLASISSDPKEFQIVFVAGTLVVYVYIIIEVINKCFSMIFEVPDKMLRWIGAQQEQSSGAQALASVQRGVSDSGRGAAGGASQRAGSGAGIQAQSFQMQAIGKKGAESEGGEGEGDEDGGGGGGGGGDDGR